ncbi:hypothetical protein [Streptomyces smyrnaeus]|uniref:hypothetical protein n=1 Tax=Streptomyces smyrnaeus TaxID=1387713 RepID=UPI0033F8D9DB
MAARGDDDSAETESPRNRCDAGARPAGQHQRCADILLGVEEHQQVSEQQENRSCRTGDQGNEDREGSKQSSAVLTSRPRRRLGRFPVGANHRPGPLQCLVLLSDHMNQVGGGVTRCLPQTLRRPSRGVAESVMERLGAQGLLDQFFDLPQILR